MARYQPWLCLALLAFAPHALAAEAPAFPAHLDDATDDGPRDLAMAASCIERGQDAAAVPYLARYVSSHPERTNARAYLAELLWRTGRLADARTEFDRFVRESQQESADLARQVHAHTRLISIAEREKDIYSAHLNRAIGLYLIASQAKEEAERERLLCKAAGELAVAQRAMPDAARTYWYQYLVWNRLGQAQPAAKGLDGARARRHASDLTPAERTSLALTVGTRGRK